MKNKSTSTQKKIVKEISEGVYINTNPISSDKGDFEKAIEDSFKEIDENDGLEFEKNKKNNLIPDKPKKD